MTEDYSFEYKRAIAHLAEKLRKTDFITKCDLVKLTKSDNCWDLLVVRFPQAQELAYVVEAELDGYELSFNQCCNALYWIQRYNPSEWRQLLNFEQC
jgi:hypothetical protein